jgi:hypothetical protein
VVAVTGAILASRLPRNVVGWLLLALPLGLALGVETNTYATFATRIEPLPAPGYIAWIGRFGNPLWLGSIPLLFVVFPDGRLPSPRWRAAVVVVGVETVILVLQIFRPGDLGGGVIGLRNPIALEGQEGLFALLGGPLQGVALVASFFLGLSGMLARFRRSRTVERQQLNWFMYATALISVEMVVLTLALILGADPIVGNLAFGLVVLTVGFLPVAAAIAILRYRLYDIDLLINRTLVYGATSAAIAATFWVGILALQALLGPLTSGSELAVAASTLVSFALFQPVRRRVQDAVDRRFDRSRYDAARTLDVFADRLRDEVDLDTLRADLIGAVRQTMSPAHASVWLREIER